MHSLPLYVAAIFAWTVCYTCKIIDQSLLIFMQPLFDDVIQFCARARTSDFRISGHNFSCHIHFIFYFWRESKASACPDGESCLQARYA